jgi:hypothetical protein
VLVRDAGAVLSIPWGGVAQALDLAGIPTQWAAPSFVFVVVALGVVHPKIVKRRSPARKKKHFSEDLSNSIRPFDYVVKAGQPARQKGSPGEIRYAKNLQIACRFRATPFD